MQQANPIDKLVTHLLNYTTQNPTVERHLQLELGKAVRLVYSEAIAQSTGYCMTLKVPEATVLGLGAKMDLETSDIQSAFATTWEIPSTVYMANNPYYHTLLLLVLYGVHRKNETIQKDALTLLLVKMWNGRRIHYIPICKPDVMRYVIANLTGKYLARKYENPMALIVQYFVPTLLETYSEKSRVASYTTKRLFDQSWGRLQQLFIQQKMPDLKTGENKARSGLAPLYYTAEKAGLKISKPSSNMSDIDDDSTTSVDYYSSNEFDDIISGLINFIVMNVNPNYDPHFVEFIVKTTTVNKDATQFILQGMHNNKYADYIRDILELMFKQLQVHSKSEICSKEFLVDTIKKRFISSKHSPIITQLKNIINTFLEHIFEDMSQKMGRSLQYSGYSVPRQGHIRKVIFYGFAYNIQKFMCTGSGGNNNAFAGEQ